jgi:hypothetical protein
MKEEKAFTALIYFLVFSFFQKIYDFIISVIYPEQQKYLDTDLYKIELRKFVIRMRSLFGVISLLWIIYLLGYYTYNTIIYLILFFIFFSNIYYFLFERKIIYWLYDKEKIDLKMIDMLDKEGGIVINVLYLFVFSYIMCKLFKKM